jgi:hypothetical protein
MFQHSLPVITLLSFLVVGFAVVNFRNFKEFRIQPHLLEHTVEVREHFLSEEDRLDLLDLAKEVSRYPSVNDQLKFYKTKNKHIGEAISPGANGQCPIDYFDPMTWFLIPNQIDKSLCTLPLRFDVGQHFIMTGGPTGQKVQFEALVSQIFLFVHFIFEDVERYALPAQIMRSEKFIELGRSVCPSDKQYLDLFQMNFLIMLPGQTLGYHIDVPIFWGATRFEYPPWLLAIMKFSALFEDHFVPQVQAVAYLHSWKPDEKERSGEFIYYDQDGEIRVPPEPGLTSVVDGTRTIHGVRRYKPELLTTVLDNWREYKVVYAGDDSWELIADEKVVKNYTTDDLRLSMVYRAKCFKDEAEKEEFDANSDSRGSLSLDYILETLVQGLVDRGDIDASEKANLLSPPNRLLLAGTLTKHYVTYPAPEDVAIPFNYCTISKLLPWTRPLVSPFCDQ